MEYRNCSIAKYQDVVCVLIPSGYKLPRENRKLTFALDACETLEKHGKIVRVIDTATDTMYFSVNCRDHRR